MAARAVNQAEEIFLRFLSIPFSKTQAAGKLINAKVVGQALLFSMAMVILGLSILHFLRLLLFWTMMVAAMAITRTTTTTGAITATPTPWRRGLLRRVERVRES